MKRILALVFLVLFLGSCGGKQPPTPTPAQFCGDGQCSAGIGESPITCPADCPKPPPPHGFCGDGICGPAETVETCKRDCITTTDCNNNGVCDAGETPENCADCKPSTLTCEKGVYDAGCPKITRDFSENRILGNYTGPLGQASFDWDAYFKLFPTTHKSFNWHKNHNLSPWDNDGTFGPWEYKNGKYTKNWNEKWWTQYRWMKAAAAYYDIGIVDVMMDQYCNKNCGFCKPEWYTMTEHPFQRVCTDSSNNGVNLYKNWRGRLPVCDNAYLMCWIANDEFNTDAYKATSLEGEMWMAYMERAAKETAQIKREQAKLGRTLRQQWVIANESYYYVTKENSCKGTESHGSLDPSKSRFLDDRYWIWFSDKLAENGMRTARDDVWFSINEEFRYQNRYEDMCWTIKVYNYLSRNRQLYELHGVADVRRVQQFTIKMGLDDDWLHLSSDGVAEDGAYYTNMKAISKMKLKWFDYKLFEAGPRFKSANEKAKYYVPRMEKAIFQ